LIDRILDAEVVLVSPLVRALETCILILATAVKRKTGGLLLLDKMRFVVMSDLRETLASDSDKPGASGINITEHLTEAARQQGNWIVPYVQKLMESYHQEEKRTNRFEEDPDNVEKFLAAIRRSRATLEGIPESRILIVGHNGWSRWTFASGLEGACPDEPTNSELHHVAFGGRHAQPLANLGMVTAKFARKEFRNVIVHDAEKGKCKKTKFALFSSVQEAKYADIIPEDASVHQVFLPRTPRVRGSGYKMRWLTFSATGGDSMLAWGDKMAEPLKFIHFAPAKQVPTLKYACDFEEETLHISSWTKKVSAVEAKDMTVTKVPPLRLVTSGKESTPSSRTNFKRLCLLMRIHTKFAGNATFIANHFKDIGWSEDMSEADLDVLLTQSNTTWEDKYRHTAWHAQERSIQELRAETKKSWPWR